MRLTWPTAAKLKMIRKKSALACRATLQRWPWGQSDGKRASANNSIRGRFRSFSKPSDFCHSQNRPSTVAEEDFFLGALPAETCAPGIRREGNANRRLGFSGLVVGGRRTSDQFQFVSFYGDGQ